MNGPSVWRDRTKFEKSEWSKITQKPLEISTWNFARNLPCSAYSGQNKTRKVAAVGRYALEINYLKSGYQVKDYANMPEVKFSNHNSRQLDIRSDLYP